MAKGPSSKVAPADPRAAGAPPKKGCCGCGSRASAYKSAGQSEEEASEQRDAAVAACEEQLRAEQVRVRVRV